MHSAKGLEFPHVFLVGFEDGLFPGMRAIGDREEMEEERRLCYVAITRAKENLTISYAKQRMLYGRTNAAMSSRFLREIPENLTVKKGGTYTASAYRASPPQQRTTTYQSPYSYATTKRSSIPELNKGDMIQHTAFGRGMVLSAMKMGGDVLLEIAFDQIGTKKLMVKSASDHIKKL
jgi:DNA helicase-2/ATP-dependent DNA helicase PcrA